MGHAVSRFVVGSMAFAPPPHATYARAGRRMLVVPAVGEHPPRLLASAFYIHDGDRTALETDAARIAAAPDFPVLLFSHGNADDLGTCDEYCHWLSFQLGVHVVAYDYQGYGLSSPLPSDEPALRDFAERVHAEVAALLPRSPLFLLGKSLGSVPATWLASLPHVEYAGLVVVSGLASGARTVFPRMPALLPARATARLDCVFGNNIGLERRVHAPVLVVHGLDDATVPVDNARDVLRALPAACFYPPLFVRAGHNDIETRHAALFLMTLANFIAQYAAPSPVAAL